MASPRPTGADPLGAGAGRRRRQGAFLCTDLKPTEILGWFVRRWRVEVTFAEVRRHLGVERQWSDLAILRTTPALLGLFSLVTLWANRIKGEHGVLPDRVRWYPKANPTFSDALALVPLELWTSPTCHRITGRAQKIPTGSSIA